MDAVLVAILRNFAQLPEYIYYLWRIVPFLRQTLHSKNYRFLAVCPISAQQLQSLASACKQLQQLKFPPFCSFLLLAEAFGAYSFDDISNAIKVLRSAIGPLWNGCYERFKWLERQVDRTIKLTWTASRSILKLKSSFSWQRQLPQSASAVNTGLKDFWLTQGYHLEWQACASEERGQDV